MCLYTHQEWGFEVPSPWSRLAYKLGLSSTNDINDMFCKAEESNPVFGSRN